MRNVANIVLNDFTNDSRVFKSSKSLSELGNNVVVVAMHSPNLKKRETVGGVEVERIKLISRTWGKIKLVQFIKYFEFILRASWRYRKSDIIHCNDLSALPVGVIIKLFRRKSCIVYDCHEYETETNGLKGFEKKLKYYLERALIPFADKVICVSDSIANEYTQIYDIPKPNVVLNCPAYVVQPKRNLFREQLGIEKEQKIFLYQGALSKGRGVELLLDAFSQMGNDNVLVCMGYGALERAIKEAADSHENIFFYPAVSPSVLLNYTSSADYGISFIEDSCLSYRYCLPNKMFEYLMAGLPVITSNLQEMRLVVETEGVGTVANENTVPGFKCAIESSLQQDYAATQKNVYEARKKYCWEEQEEVLKQIYNEL